MTRALGVALTILMVASPALAQQITLDLGEGPTLTGRVVQLFSLVM